MKQSVCATYLRLIIWGPSYDIIKCTNIKGVWLIAEEPTSLFACIANVCKKAKLAHKVEEPILVILVEDEIGKTSLVVFKRHDVMTHILLIMEKFIVH